MAADGNLLAKKNPLVQTVTFDTLDEASIEQRICQMAPDMNVVNGFCDKCQDMFDRSPFQSYLSPAEPREGKGYAHAGTYHTVAIEASTRCGCKFCAFLLQLLKDQDILDIFRRIEMRLEQLGEGAETFLSVDKSWLEGYNELWLDLPNKPSTQWKRGIGCKRICCYSIDKLDCASQFEDILDMANLWLQKCWNNHCDCHSDMDSHKLPTRLVSISSGAPRVEITANWEDLRSPLRYATLSYCWGSRPFIRLTKHNFSDLTKRIPMDSFPRTFSDAFQIAKAVGISYIWIDSLCIVQDDDDDWQKEADLMQSVYSGSHLNIAAASATDAYGGCFVKPPYFRDGVQAKINIQGTEVIKEFSYQGFYKRSILNSHLMSRGWAIQEKLLAPRTIHFGDRGAIWECAGTVVSEFFPKWEPEGLGTCLLYRQMRDRYDWSKVVRVYSATNLTYPRDKIPALAGIARAVAKDTGREYVAGLWKRNLEDQLWWYPIGKRRTRKRPCSHELDWVAPSWSWASIDGPVQYGNRLGEFRYAHVFKTTMTFSGPGPFGQPSRGVLHLNCSAIIVGRLRQIPAPGYLEPRVGIYHNMIDDDLGHIIYQSEFTESVSISTSEGQKFIPVKIDCMDDCQMHDRQTIYLIPISDVRGMPGRTEQEDPNCYHEHLGVVVRETGASPGEFCRIGLFHFSEICPEQRQELGYNTQSFREILDQNPDTTAKAVCSEVVSNSDFPAEKYVISLV